jgi:undecaprenyl diphosphate synthase
MIERALHLPALDVIPKHVAIIMDGNRRWAREHGLPATEGHRLGVRALRRTARACADAGVEVLTVYTFSVENWQRESSEVEILMHLMQRAAISELASLYEEGVRVRIIGRPESLPLGTRRALDRLVEKTSSNTRLTLNLAINYSGRTELQDAIVALVNDVTAGKLSSTAIDDQTISRYLYTGNLPDPDLLIRTSGEIAYSEFWSTPVRWPDFDAEHLHEAFTEFNRRKRRYGR